MPDITDKLFEIVRSNHARRNKSIAMPAAACPIGTAFIEDPANPGVAKLADGSAPIIGFVDRDVIVGVPLPTIGELAGGLIALPAVSPYSTTEMGSAEDADEFIAEGKGDALTTPDYINSTGGANDITPATTVGTKCAFVGGKVAKATTGMYAEFTLQEQLTPLTAGNTRCRFRRIAGVIV